MASRKDPRVRRLSSAASDQLGFSEEITAKLEQIEAEVDRNYREAFADMAQAMARQASALDRMQRTLELLVEAVKPELKSQLPPTLRVANPGEDPDLASIAVGDPVGLGYTMSQAALAEAVGITQPDLSILAKAFDLKSDEDCAMVVRRGRGKGRDLVNYHPRTISRLRELIAKEHRKLTKTQQAALRRARKALILEGNPGS